MNRKKFLERLENEILVLDGGYGTEFFKMGYGDFTGEVLNLKYPEIVLNLQKKYVQNGSDILLTNTFNANPLKLKEMGLQEIFRDTNIKAVEIAKKAGNANTIILGDISSTGNFIEPFGKNSFDSAVDSYKKQAEILNDCGVDGFIVETMSDMKELKAAVIGIRKISKEKPLIAHMTFEENLRSVTGTSVKVFASLFNDLDVDVIGLNCSTGPKPMLNAVKELRKYTNKPISVEPNAGKPKYDEDRLYYDVKPEDFAIYIEDFISAGANIIGGCCGTSEKHIRVISRFAKKTFPKKRERKITQALSSRTIFHEIDPFLIIGERVNPASKMRFQEELNSQNFSRALKIGEKQKKEGSHILDINLGIEKELSHSHFSNIIKAFDKQSSLPLSLDIQMNKYLTTAIREYVGRPLINSARVTSKSLNNKIKLLKDYGGMLVLLAMGKKIPKLPEERVKLILEGIKELERNGISRDRILADALVMSFGANYDPEITKKTIEQLSEHGIKTTIGLSNLSFGMPGRSFLNGSFLSQCINKNLSSAIMNTGDEFVMGSLFGSLKLEKKEINKKEKLQVEDPILDKILSGDKKGLKKDIKNLLQEKTPLEISQNILGKSMQKIGDLYSEGKIYLPHLLLASETAEPSFDLLNSKTQGKIESKGKILLATVEGDIHDIGKKIVGTVLKSSGFEIIDIGVDVSSKDILLAAKKYNPDIIGLSAMMTTTIVRIEEVKKELDSDKIKAFLIAGGASMNKKLAEKFGCNGYSKDASSAVRLCEKLLTR